MFGNIRLLTAGTDRKSVNNYKLPSTVEDFRQDVIVLIGGYTGLVVNEPMVCHLKKLVSSC